MIGKVSFPQARSNDVRAYTRKGLLRKEMEDIEYGDDEVEDEEETEGWSEAREDGDAHQADIDVDTDEESFD
jgi:hypothetical protein